MDDMPLKVGSVNLRAAVPPWSLGQQAVHQTDELNATAQPRSGMSLVVNAGMSVPKLSHACSVDTDCGGHARCDTESGECATLPFGAVLWKDLLMFALGFVVAAISLAAGVGGGGLNVPLLMTVLSFDAHVATAMSQAMLTGGALAAFLYNYQDSHPDWPKRPLINFELASLIGAAVVAGAQVGSLLHATAPPAIILILLCVVLSDAARKGVLNARKISKQESAKKDAAEGPTATDDDSDKVCERNRAGQRNLMLFWIACLVLIVCKGLIFRICTTGWWVMTIAAVVVLGGFTYKLATSLQGMEHVNGDLDYQESAFSLAYSCVLAGCLAALCGIGGGMVMGPILVQMKVSPPVASATTATTLFVLSSSTVVMYALRGVCPWRYALVLSCSTFLGAGTGKVLIGRWVKKSGKQSGLVWMLAGITILSTLLMAFQGVRTVLENGWDAFHFRNFCKGVRSDLEPQDEMQSLPHDEAHFFFRDFGYLAGF